MLVTFLASSRRQRREKIMNDEFVGQLMSIGIVSYREQETVWKIAQRCARATGISVAGAGAIAGVGVGAVTIPGIGAIPGALAGFLAGLVGGTAMCTIANATLRDQLRELARDARTIPD